jgi:hypothetical protein
MLPLTAAVLIIGIVATLIPAENYLGQTPSREVAVLQTCLQALNIEPGPIDGWPRPRTKTALESWSKACFGADWQQQSIPAIAVGLEAGCDAALYKSEPPINFGCHTSQMGQ